MTWEIPPWFVPENDEMVILSQKYGILKRYLWLRIYREIGNKTGSLAEISISETECHDFVFSPDVIIKSGTCTVGLSNSASPTLVALVMEGLRDAHWSSRDYKICDRLRYDRKRHARLCQFFVDMFVIRQHSKACVLPFRIENLFEELICQCTR